MIQNIAGQANALFVNVDGNMDGNMDVTQYPHPHPHPFLEEQIHRHQKMKPHIAASIQKSKQIMWKRWKELGHEYMIRKNHYMNDIHMNDNDINGKISINIDINGNGNGKKDNKSSDGNVSHKNSGSFSIFHLNDSANSNSNSNADNNSNNNSNCNNNNNDYSRGNANPYRRPRRGNGGMTSTSINIGVGDVVRSEYEQEQIIAELTAKEAMEKRISTGSCPLPRQQCQLETDLFATYENHQPHLKIDHPMAHELDKQRENPWTDVEKCIFLDRFLQDPKHFSKIAASLKNKSTKECIAFYYRSKKSVPYKAALREFHLRKKRHAHIRGDNVHMCWDATIQAALSMGAIVTPGPSRDRPVIISLATHDNTFHSRDFHPMKRHLYDSLNQRQRDGQRQRQRQRQRQKSGNDNETDKEEDCDKDYTEETIPSSSFPHKAHHLFLVDEFKFLRTVSRDSIHSNSSSGGGNVSKKRSSIEQDSSQQQQQQNNNNHMDDSHSHSHSVSPRPSSMETVETSSKDKDNTFILETATDTAATSFSSASQNTQEKLQGSSSTSNNNSNTTNTTNSNSSEKGRKAPQKWSLEEKNLFVETVEKYGKSCLLEHFIHFVIFFLLFLLTCLFYYFVVSLVHWFIISLASKAEIGKS